MAVRATRTDKRLTCRLRELADAKGYSLLALSKKLGLAQSTLSQIATGERAPSPLVIVALCDEFECTPGDLMYVKPVS